jgi:hypothetical protein
MQALGCLVDYLGFRALVLCVPPVDDDNTLAVGRLAPSAPYTRKSPVLSSMLKRAMRHLNLKPHTVSVNDDSGSLATFTIPTPVNLQGHACADSRFYVMELGRLFPGDAPAPGTNECVWRLATRARVPFCSPFLFSFLACSDVRE